MNGVNPFSHIISLLAGRNFKNEVDLCINFGIEPESNPPTTIY